MAEVLTFSEGQAYARTGNASALLSYVRGVTITPQITFQHYRPPHATTYTDYPIASAAQLTVQQARAQIALMKMFMGVTAGGFHFHSFQSAPNLTQSAGAYLYSGNLQSVSISEQTDTEVTLSFAAIFPTWTAY